MERQRNRRLEQLLTDHGYSHSSLAAAVNAVCKDIYGRSGGCTDRHVRRWTSGEVRWPWVRYLLALQEIFGLPAEGMGFVPRGRAALPVPPRPRTPPQERSAPAVQRRRFVVASTAATVAAALGIEGTPATGRLSMADIDRVHATIGRLDSHFFSIGGGPLVVVARAYIDRLQDALNGCTYGERVERALHGAISSLYAAAGWAAHDSGDPAQAALLHTAALQSALLSRDPSAVARAWSNLGLQARAEGRHREALQITRTALESRRTRTDPRISALLHARLAIGQAHLGDAAGSGRSLLAAEQAYDRAAGEPTQPWLSFVNPAELSGLAAIAHQALGRYAPAEAATGQALELLPAGMRRNRAYYTVQLAELQLARGELERAAATVAGIDADSLDSRRITGRLADVRRALGHVPDHPRFPKEPRT